MTMSYYLSRNEVEGKDIEKTYIVGSIEWGDRKSETIKQAVSFLTAGPN